MSEATYHDARRREPGNPQIDPATADRLRKISRLMDSAFTVPGTNRSFGLDPIIGLIPGIGDAVSVAISLYTIDVARKHGIAKHKLLLMVGNLAVDALVGTIPLVGDLFDFAFKANQRNLKLMGIDPGTPRRDRR